MVYSKTKILTESAVLLALATLLSLYPKIEGIWANGGSITICSMLPIVLISYRHGLKWGLLSGFAFGILNLVTGGLSVPANSFGVVIAGALLDYILPYTFIGLGGMFRNTIKSPAYAMIAGIAVSFFLRYICHVISGSVFWYDVAYATEILSSDGFAFGFGKWLSVRLSGGAIFWAYNLLYNASYMLPELIITSAGAAILAKVLLKIDSKNRTKASV